MSAPKITPNWLELFTMDLLKKSFSSNQLQKLLKKAQKEYLHWDTFKFQEKPDGFSLEEAWALVKWMRVGQYQSTPAMSLKGSRFQFALTNALYEKLNYIDTYASGFINTLSKSRPTETQKNKFIMSGLTEEAIATSQIEGANTSRKVAKEMIASQRKPKTKDGQMIVNSFKVMQKLDEWKHDELSVELLLEIQSMVTEKTLEDSSAQGRLRTDQDEIVVSDPLTGEIAHTPPDEKEMTTELKRLVSFANRDEENGDFIHPVVKAAILHFWLAYLHPFVDGNGRTARAIFYWYLLKKEYWLVQYLSVSRVITQFRKKYDDAFLYTETDDNDLTYFILYITDCFKSSIVKFIDYFQEQKKRTEEFKETANALRGYNSRQIALINFFLENPKETTTVAIHQMKHGISRATANNDLMNLVKKDMLVYTARGKRYIFMPNILFMKRLLAP